MPDAIFSDTPLSTRVLAPTATSAEFDVRDGGLYNVGVLDLPAGATVSVDAYMGRWVEVNAIIASDLRPDNANFSGATQARFSPGRWRFTVAAAGPSVYVGGAGE